MVKKLNARERLFVAEYLIDLDVKRAALAAGYSPSMANSKAFQWVSESKHNPKPSIYNEIQQRLKKTVKKLEITAEETIKAVHHQAFNDPRKLFLNGGLRDIEHLDLETAQTITGFNFMNIYRGKGKRRRVFGQLRKIKLTDRLKALELLGKYQRLWTEKVEHSLDADTRRLVAARIDLTNATPEQLAELESLGSGNHTTSGG
jgi:phage terminase small subunit